MADVISLRQARKRKERADKAAAASVNRTRHGRSKSERNEARLGKDLTEARLDAHRRDPPHESD